MYVTISYLLSSCVLIKPLYALLREECSEDKRADKELTPLQGLLFTLLPLIFYLPSRFPIRAAVKKSLWLFSIVIVTVTDVLVTITRKLTGIPSTEYAVKSVWIRTVPNLLIEVKKCLYLARATKTRMDPPLPQEMVISHRITIITQGSHLSHHPTVMGRGMERGRSQYISPN